MIRVVLFSRPGCHLCEIVERTLRHVQSRRAFALTVENIDQDPQQQWRYGHDIPVITVDGKEIARHHLTAAALESALDAATASQAQ